MSSAPASSTRSPSAVEGCEIRDVLSTLNKTRPGLVSGITFQLWIFAISKLLFSLKENPKSNKRHRCTCISRSVYTTHRLRSTTTGAIFKNAGRYLGKIVVGEHTSHLAERAQNLVVKETLFWGETLILQVHMSKRPTSPVFGGGR